MSGAVIPDCAADYTSTQDPSLQNNQACVNTLVNLVNPARSVIRVTKHGPAVVHPGEAMTYSIDVPTAARPRDQRDRHRSDGHVTGERHLAASRLRA